MWIKRASITRNLIARAPARDGCVQRAAASNSGMGQQLSSTAAAFRCCWAHAMGYGGCWLTDGPVTPARAAPGSDHERIASFVYLGTVSQPAIEHARSVTSRISRF
jgi:hypothetical protein